MKKRGLNSTEGVLITLSISFWLAWVGLHLFLVSNRLKFPDSPNGFVYLLSLRRTAVYVSAIEFWAFYLLATFWFVFIVAYVYTYRKNRYKNRT